MPPITRNTSAEAPYMIPIFLWSTVLIHERQPVVARGRANTPRALCALGAPEGSARVSEGRSTIAMERLLQRLQVGDEQVDLLIGEIQVGHAALLAGRHRLLRRRVLQPLLEVGHVEHALAANLGGFDLAAAVLVDPEVEDGA